MSMSNAIRISHHTNNYRSGRTTQTVAIFRGEKILAKAERRRAGCALMLTDRKGRRVSELSGPGTAGAYARPPEPQHTLKPGAAWRRDGWFWCARSLAWLPQWHHVSLPVTSVDFGDYVAGTTNFRHWRTAPTPAALLESMFPIGVHDAE